MYEFLLRLESSSARREILYYFCFGSSRLNKPHGAIIVIFVGLSWDCLSLGGKAGGRWRSATGRNAKRNCFDGTPLPTEQRKVILFTMTMTLLKATIAVTVLAATASTANGQDFPPEAYPHPYPVARFTPWKYIQDTASVDALNYREFTWNFATNYESANIIEDVPYAALTPQEAEAAANLGISPESWDCEYRDILLAQTGHIVFLFSQRSLSL